METAVHSLYRFLQHANSFLPAYIHFTLFNFLLTPYLRRIYAVPKPTEFDKMHIMLSRMIAQPTDNTRKAEKD